MKKSIVAACFLLLASAVGAEAATITFTSSAAFFAALGATPFATETYEGLAVNSPIAAGATVNGITYNSFPAGTTGRIDGVYQRIGAQSLALARTPSDFFLDSESLTVSFASTTAIGIFFNVGTSPVNSLFIQTSVGNAGNGATYDQSTLYFVGLISDTSFNSATIGGTGAISTGFNLDNLTRATGPAAVPEPASMVLLGTGLAALALRARRSRRA